MRLMKFLAVAGLILAVNGTAGALTFNTPWAGPITLHVTNYATGTTYDGTYDVGGGVYKATFDTVSGKWLDAATGLYTESASQLYDASKCGVLGAAQNAKAGENGWGIFQVDNIQEGVFDAVNNKIIVNPAHSAAIWTTNATDGTEIVGAYFDRKDIAVRFTTAGDQFIEAAGDQYQMWEQAYGVSGVYDPTQGTAGRLLSAGLPIDKYNTVGYDALGNPIAGAVNILNGVSTTGFVGALAATEVFADFTPDSSSGKVNIFIDVTGGTLMSIFDTNIFVSPKGGPNADIRLDVGDEATTVGGLTPWLTHSSDPLQMDVVPEPITMFSAFLGICGLGTYIRRRMKVTAA